MEILPSRHVISLNRFAIDHSVTIQKHSPFHQTTPVQENAPTGQVYRHSILDATHELCPTARYAAATESITVPKASLSSAAPRPIALSLSIGLRLSKSAYLA